MLRLTTLGATDLRDRHGRAVRDILAQPKRVALLLYLAVEGSRGPVSRDRVLALFWPESDETRARNALSQALHHLRQALGPGVIESQGVHTVGVDGERLWCDATVFSGALERGEHELALDLYRGDFCPTLFVSGAPDVEQWLDAQRRQLRGQALAALHTLAERLAGRGDAAGAARTARRALAMHPDDEGEVRTFLALLERAGDVTGALLAYQEHARRLGTELETEPAPETKRLVDAMRRRREAASATAPERAAILPRGEPRAVAAPPAAPASRRRARPARLAALAIVLLAAGAAVVLSRVGRPPAAVPVKTLAVMPFTVRGGATLAYLRDGMVDLLSAKLDGAAGFRAVDPRSVIAAVGGGGPDAAAGPDASARIAHRLGARWYVVGTVVEVAGRLQISGSLRDGDGGLEPVAAASVSGDSAALFELVDDLTGRMLAGLVSGRDTVLTRLAAVTTHSLPALKAFLQGEQALRAGLDAQAAAAFRDAALLDTTFALAQYRLAVTSTWVTVEDVTDPAVWAATAARHSRRLTPLVRDLLQAYHAYKDIQADEAERIYLGVTQEHPDNVEAWLMLGETRFHYGSWRGRSPVEAWPAFERVLELDPANAHAMIHLARLAALVGRGAALDSLAQRFIEGHADAERTLEIRALRAYQRDDPGERAAIARAALATGDYAVSSMLQDAALFAQNLDAARELAPAFTGPARRPVVLLGARRTFAELGVAGGRWGDESAAAPPGPPADDDWRLEVQALLASDPFFSAGRARLVSLRDRIAARRSYPGMNLRNSPAPMDLGPAMRAYLLGLLDARLGDTAAAALALAELAAVRDAQRAGVAQALAQGLRAEIARARGDPRRALAEVEQFPFDAPVPGIGVLSHWGVRERFLRAELLLALGRDDDAFRWYDSFAGSFDLPYMAAAHLRRAEIRERLGDSEQARFHYARFLRLWKNCDPEFRPMTTRAAQALTRLEAHRMPS